MKALSKNERYTFAGLLSYALLHFVLWCFNGLEIEQGGYWWTPGMDLDYYELAEFIFYAFVPLAIFAIYYFVLRKND